MLTHTTELMQTYRNARVMDRTSTSDIKTVQTEEGHSLLLSIVFDRNVPASKAKGEGGLICTRETPMDPLGWVQTDLASALSEDFPGKTMFAKMFDAVQDPYTRLIDLALVLSDGASDFLYISFDNPAPKSKSAFNPSWQKAPLHDSLKVSGIAAKFVSAELMKLSELAARLLKPVRAIDTWLAGQLSLAQKEVVKLYNPEDRVSAKSLATCLTEFLNARVDGPLIFEAPRFAGVRLRDSTKALLSKGVPDGGRYLNRLLLEDAYPLELGHSRAVQWPIRFCDVNLAIMRGTVKYVIADIEREPSKITQWGEQKGAIARFCVELDNNKVRWNHWPLPPNIRSEPATNYAYGYSSRTFQTLFAPRFKYGGHIFTLRKANTENAVSIVPVGNNFIDLYSHSLYENAYDLFRPETGSEITLIAASLAKYNEYGYKNQYTHLFLITKPLSQPTGLKVGKPTLYFLDGTSPLDNAKIKKVCEHALFADTTDLHFVNEGSTTVLLGRTKNRILFSMECPAGEEGNQDAWSEPTEIMVDVTGVACQRRSLIPGSIVAFVVATVGGKSRVLRLSRDTETSRWQTEPILLPTSDPEETYPSVGTDGLTTLEEDGIALSTRILATELDGRSASDLSLTVASNSLCSVRINNRYYLLSPTPTPVQTDALGALNIEQQVDSLGAVCYTINSRRPITDNATNPATTKPTLVINPMAGIVEKLKAVKTGADLPPPPPPPASLLKNRGGKRSLIVYEPLPSAEVVARNREVAAQAIVELVKAAQTMPPDGSLSPEAQVAKPSGVTRKGMVRGFGISYTSQGAIFHNQPPAATRNILKKFKKAFGDVVKAAKNALEKVTKIFFTFVDKVVTLVIELAGEIMEFAVRCIDEVLKIVDIVLSKVGVSLKGALKWLGRILGWYDIIEGQKVLSKMIRAYVNNIPAELSTMDVKIGKTIDSALQSVNKWGPTPPVAPKSKSLSTVFAAVPETRSFFGLPVDISNGLPSVTWALNAFSEHAPKIGFKGVALDASVKVAIQNAVEVLAEQVKKDFGRFHEASLAMADLVRDLPKLSDDETILRLRRLITGELVGLTKSGLLLARKLFLAIGNLILTVLDAPIKIPIFSALYKAVGGAGELTLLSLISLVGAIGVAALDPNLLKGYAKRLRNASSFTQIRAALASEVWEVWTPPTRGSSKALRGMKVQGLQKIANILGFVGGTLTALTTPIKLCMASTLADDFYLTKIPALAANLALTVPSVINIMPGVLSAFLLPSVSPQTTADVLAVYGATVGGLAALKVLAVDVGLALVQASLTIPYGPVWAAISELIVSFISTGLDFTISVLGLVPTVGNFILDRSSTSSVLNFTGGVLSCAGGIISPAFWIAQACVTGGQAVIVTSAKTVAGIYVGAIAFTGGTVVMWNIGYAQGACAAASGSMMLAGSYFK